MNVDWFFVSHRLPIALAAMQRGFEVHLACTVGDHVQEIEASGIRVHHVPIRGRRSAYGQLATLAALIGLMRRLRPDIVHLVTISPVLLGGVAARITKVPAVVAAISGMGYVFIAHGWRARLRRTAISLLYRVALRGRNVRVIVQNPEDRELVRRLTNLDSSNIETIRGSGVDLSACAATPLPEGTPTVVFAARLLADKGLREFITAARILRREDVHARFLVAGDPDPFNPASVSQTEIETWRAEGVVELIGFQPDIATLFSQVNVVVLPSYREGLPKVLLEAAACGRAVVTTDVTGCRDAVQAGRSALLVPPRQAEPLADAIRTLLGNPLLCQRLGEQGRRLAEAEFSIDQVIEEHLRIYSQGLEEPQ